MSWQPHADPADIRRCLRELGWPQLRLDAQADARGIWLHMRDVGRDRPPFGDAMTALVLHPEPVADAGTVQLALRGGATMVVTRAVAQAALPLARMIGRDLDELLLRQRGRAATVLRWLGESPSWTTPGLLGELAGWAAASHGVLVHIDGGDLRAMDVHGEGPNIGAVLDAGDHTDLRTVSNTGRPQFILPDAAEGLRDLLQIPADVVLRSTMPILIGNRVSAILRLDWLAAPNAAALRGLGHVSAAIRRLGSAPRGRGRPQHTQEELRQLELVFNQVGDGLLVVNREATIRRVNRRLRGMLGYDEADMIGRSVLEFTVPAERKDLVQRIARLRIGDFRDRRWPLQLLRRDGTPHPFEVGVEPLAGMGGSVIVVLHDLSELHALNHALAEANLYLENVIQSSPDAIIAADLNGRISLFNPSAQVLTGWTAAMLDERGEGIERFYPIDEARRVMAEMRKEAAEGGKGQVRNLRTTLIARDGQQIPILINAALLRNEQGNPTGSVGIFTDLRQIEAIEQALDEARQQLIQSEREAAVAALAGAAAHHLNQPLTAVMGYAELLRRRQPQIADDPALARIEDAAQRMAEIVREIGRITRYEVRGYAEGEQIMAIGGDGDAED